MEWEYLGGIEVLYTTRQRFGAVTSLAPIMNDLSLCLALRHFLTISWIIVDLSRHSSTYQRSDLSGYFSCLTTR